VAADVFLSDRECMSWQLYPWSGVLCYPLLIGHHGGLAAQPRRTCITANGLLSGVKQGSFFRNIFVFADILFD
jgi:hypothetical protein